MFRHQTWVPFATACALLLVPLWWILFMQALHISFIDAKIKEFSSNSHYTNNFVRKFMLAYEHLPIEDHDIKIFYTYVKSEVEHLNNLSQEDPALIQHIQKALLVPPPEASFVESQEDTSRGQAKKIIELFKNKTEGIFIECGAADGVYRSNTLFLEMNFKWTGLLIEAEPSNFGSLFRSGRNAWVLPACLSLKTSPMMVRFPGLRAWSKISDYGVNVHCMPLYSILSAFNRTTIDFFSLDIEGNELDVLRTLPFDKVDIKTFAVEFSNIKEGKEHLLQFMLEKGYYELPSTPEERGHKQWAQEDYIFVKK